MAECPERIDCSGSEIEIGNLETHRKILHKLKVETYDTGNNVAGESQRVPLSTHYLGGGMERHKLPNAFYVYNKYSVCTINPEKSSVK